MPFDNVASSQQPLPEVPGPFIIYGLPRSRTFWLSQFLSYGGRSVGHDIAIEADTVQGFVDNWSALAGTVENGTMRAWRLLQKASPTSRVVTVRRPRAEVEASLTAQGIEPDTAELIERDRLLDEVEAAGAPRIEYAALSDARICAWLFEYLLGVPFDFRWWCAQDATNQQIDMGARMRRLQERAEPIANIKAEVARLLDGDPTFYQIRVEPISQVWPEIEAMAQRHFAEVGESQPLRFVPEMAQNLEQVGVFRIYTIRANGEIGGYCTWSVAPDLEDAGKLLAIQGGWYVDPSRKGIGSKLLKRCIADLRSAGVNKFDLHHRLEGRGADASVLFRRLGAREVQHHYALNFEDEKCRV